MEGVVVVEGWERQSVSKGENKARGSRGVLRWILTWRFDAAAVQSPSQPVTQFVTP